MRQWQKRDRSHLWSFLLSRNAAVSTRDMVLFPFGDFELIAIHIPGHTNTLTTLTVGTPYSQERFCDLTAWLNIPPTGCPLVLWFPDQVSTVCFAFSS